MMPADVMGYAAAVDTYWNAGWRGVLPLHHGHKGGTDSGLPTGFTGYEGVEPSYADVTAWSETFIDGNLCLRLPDGVIGIDVDGYGAKTGAKAFVEALRRWRPLPPAPRSTSRDADPLSGIRLFKVPPGTVLETRIHFPELGIGDIEIIQRHHRYVVAWPSIHPEQRPYWWRNDENQLIGIPSIDALPWLPQSWIDGLRAKPRTQFDGPIDFNISAALTAGDPSTKVRERLSQAIKELNLPGQSRHDTCCRHVMALARLGKSGEPGVMASMQLLCDVLVAARRVDGSDSSEGTRGEFVRMLTNDNIARELSQPGFLDWMQSLIVADPNTTVATSGGSEVATTGDTGIDTSGGSVTSEPTRAISHLEEIERGFWESRESLAMVYTTALAMMASPWATLGVTAAKALHQVRPHVTLPPLISGPGSLNWFAALVARSGDGKGAANGASKLLIPDRLVNDRNLGSGEGLVALFGRSPTDDEPEPTHEAILVNVDEVDTLTALAQRTASTTMSVLRSAFMGETLGFSYVGKGKGRHIPAHSYRMTMVVSVQPKRAGPLLNDEGGGTPQRFMWFPGKDKRISMDDRWPSGPLTLPDRLEWQYPQEIFIPPEAKHTIKLNRMRNAHDEQDAIDGHALFCREKFAYALAIIDGRVNMTLEDWELSGIAADVSAYTRELCADELKSAARIDAIDRGDIRGIENHAADETKELEAAEKYRRVLRWVLAKVEAAGGDGISDGDLRTKCASRDRRYLAGALQVGTSNGLIRQPDRTTTWVKI